jgi:hypothetical protein
MANNWNAKHDWTVGEPITQEKMNRIEGGIDELYGKTNADGTDITGLKNRLEKVDAGSILNSTTLEGSQTLL